MQQPTLGPLDRRTLLAHLALLGAAPTALSLLSSCQSSTSHRTPPASGRQPSPTTFRNGAVAADHGIASEIGIEILRAGGNAVDAAIAVNAALGVVRPYSCGLGGGGFMVMYVEKSGEAWAMNARETAPPGVWETYFQDLRSAGGPEEASRYGGHAIAVPGTPSGLFLAHRTHGSLPMDRLLAPAARVAREGFEADANYLNAVASLRATRKRLPWTKTISDWTWDQLCKRGDVKEGTRIENPALANTLEKLGRDGIAAWRRGDIPRSLARVARYSGGKLTAQAISGYRAHACAPLIIEDAFAGETLVSMGLPSSGGITIAQIKGMLNVVLREAGYPPLDSPEAAHALLEAMKIAFAQRAKYLADPAFAPVPVQELLDRDRIEALSLDIQPARARSAEEISTATQLPEDSGTSHFSVIDKDRTAVAWTSTINGTFGSLVGDPQSGVVLNNEMDDFTTISGEGNLFELRQSDWNLPEPGKHPLSSMSPTIVVDDDGKIRAIAGASGGPRIISATLQVLLGIRYEGLTAEEAVQRPRLHHQWMPDAVRHEARTDQGALQQQLQERGHTFEEGNRGIAVVQAIRVEEDGFEPASDPRKGGTASGY